MAHRVVLAAASPYFVELFARDVGGPTRKEVEGGGIVYELQLESSNKEALEVLIDYAYTSMYVNNIVNVCSQSSYLYSSLLV